MNITAADKRGIAQAITLLGLLVAGLTLLILSSFGILPTFLLIIAGASIMGSFTLALLWDGFWLLGVGMIAFIWAGAPIALAWVVGIGLARIGWDPVAAWIAIPLIYFGVMAYWFTRK